MSTRPPNLTKCDALIGSGIVAIYGIKGADSNPQSVDTACVDLVHDMGAGGFAGASYQNATEVASSINGVASSGRTLIAPVGFSALTFIATTNQWARVQGITGFVTFDAAGLAAFAGKTIGIQIGLTDPANLAAGEIPIHEERIVVPAAGLIVRISCNPALWKGIVPWPMALTCTFISFDATVFPANTTGRMFVSAFKAAINQQLPT